MHLDEMSLNELRSNMRNPSHRFQIHFPLIAGHWSTQRCTIAIVKTICWEVGRRQLVTPCTWTTRDTSYNPRKEMV
jgi:hypothetical protein